MLIIEIKIFALMPKRNVSLGRGSAKKELDFACRKDMGSSIGYAYIE